MKNKLILCILALTMLLPSLPSFAADDTADEIYYDFAEGGTRSRLSVVSDGEISYKTINGRRGVYIEEAAERIVFDIDDSELTNNMGLEIDVEYYDGNSGYFTLGHYNAVGSTAYEPPVTYENSARWRTRKFAVYDFSMNDNYYGGDFALELNTTLYESSWAPMTIGKVTVKKIKPKGVEAELKSKRAGNVFVNGESIKFDLTLKSAVPKRVSYDIRYTATNAETDEQIWTGTDSVELDAKNPVSKTIEFSVEKYGLYRINIEMTDRNNEYGLIDSYKFSYSRFNQDMPLNKTYGTATHLDLRDSAAVAPLIAAAGIGYVRDELRWQDYEASPGKFAIQEKDTYYMKNVEDAGLDKLIILGYSNPLYQDGVDRWRTRIPETEAELEAYSEYCYQLVKELGDSCNRYEVWNEPNINMSDEESTRLYFPLVKTAYQAVKRANPNAEVIVGVSAGIMTDWFKMLFEMGIADYMDTLSVHYYFLDYRAMDSFSNIYNRLMTIDELLKKYKPSADIIVSEYGWVHNIFSTTQEIQRDNYLKNQTIFGKIPRIREAVWYEFQDSGWSLSFTERNFGMVEYWEEKTPHSANSLYLGVAAYNSIVGDRKVCEQYEENGDYIYRFEKNYLGNDTMMMWHERGASSVAMNLGCDKITLYDSYGNETELYGNDGVFHFILGDTPIMAEGNFKSYEMVTSDMSIDARMIVTPGEVITYAPDIPNGCKVEYKAGNAIDVLSDEGNSLTFKLDEKAGFESSIAVTITRNGKVIQTGNVIVEVQESVSAQITALPYLVQNGKNVLCVKLKNNRRDRAISGTFRLKEPQKLAVKLPETDFGELEPLSEKKFYLYIPEFEGGGYFNFVGEFKIGNDAPFTINCKYDNSYARKCTTPPVIDGIISDGEYAEDCVLKTVNENVVDLFENANQGDDDLSGNFYVTWDDEKIYIAAEITDDTHYQIEEPNMMWRGDSLQFALADGLSKEIMVGKRGNKVQVSGYDDEKYPMDIAIVRGEGNKTVYEIALPFAGIFGEEWSVAGKRSIGFSALVNDSDGPDSRSNQAGRKGWIEYGSGIGMSKNSSLYANLKLRN